MQEIEPTLKSSPLFKPVSWQTKIDFINHLVLFNNVSIVALAEKGGGKTAFTDLLREHLNSQFKVCVINAKSTKEELINTISDSLQLTRNGNQSMTSVVSQINARKSQVLLLIDNAQNLSEDWIKEAFLEIKQQEEPAFFHLCLVSDFSLVVFLNKLTQEDTQNIIHTIELGTLNEIETKTYVLYKKGISKNLDKVYSEEYFSQLYKMTGGCLAKINKHLSTFTETPTRRKKSSAIIRASLLICSLVLIAGISWFFVEISKNDLTPEPVASLSDDLIVPEPLVEIDNNQFLTSEIANLEDGSTRQFVFDALPRKQMLAMVDNSDFNEIENIAIMDKVVVIPKITSPKTVNSSTQSDSDLIEKDKNSAKEEVSLESESEGYTIQLLASHQLSDINYFIRRHKLEGKCTIRQVSNESDFWFILTMGDFQALDQASKAVGELSIELARYKPWVRPTANLQMIG